MHRLGRPASSSEWPIACVTLKALSSATLPNVAKVWRNEYISRRDARALDGVGLDMPPHIGRIHRPPRARREDEGLAGSNAGSLPVSVELVSFGWALARQADEPRPGPAAIRWRLSNASATTIALRRFCSATPKSRSRHLSRGTAAGFGLVRRTRSRSRGNRQGTGASVLATWITRYSCRRRLLRS